MTIEQKYNEGYRIFRAGGAMGFDTAAALAVLELKRIHPDIKLHLILPCKDQCAYWGAKDIAIYREILGKCDLAVYAEESYVSGCMQKRNRMLVDGARCCIAYYDGGKGGTAYTYAYACKNKLEIINLW